MKKQMKRIEEIVEQVLFRNRVFDENPLLLVAFSGGEDSMTLLRILQKQKKKSAFPLAAAYIHHGLRKEADEEERMLREWCCRWEIPFFCSHVDVEKRVREQGETVEEAARILRYKALEEIGEREAQRGGWKHFRILTAHHSDDQAETILMNLIRGASLTGLTGMKENSGRILRPLLQISKQEIREYLKEEGIFHVEDRSNQELIYRRNRIRLELIPFLQELNPRITETLNKMGRILLEDERYLEEQAEIAWENCRREDPEVQNQDALDARSAADLPKAIRLRVLRHLLHLHGGLKDISEAQLTILDHFLGAEDGKQIDLTARQIRMKNGLLVVRKPSPKCIEKEKGGKVVQDEERIDDESKREPFFEKMSPVVLDSQALGRWIETSQGSLRLTVEENPGNRIREFSKERYTKWFSCDIMTENLCLRVRETGDYLSLRQGRQSLQDLMVNQKIPRDKRDKMVLLMKGRECVWIIGSRSSEKFWVSPEDPKAIKAEWRPKEDALSSDSGERKEHSERGNAYDN